MVDRHLIDVHVLLTAGDELLLTQRAGDDRLRLPAQPSATSTAHSRRE